MGVVSDTCVDGTTGSWESSTVSSVDSSRASSQSVEVGVSSETAPNWSEDPSSSLGASGAPDIALM